jgi:DNA-binding NarL/FixJ family response regulator
VHVKSTLNMDTTNNKIRIAIVDDESLMLRLVKDFLQKTDKINVIMTADDGEVIVEKLESEEVLPEVILLDLKMKRMDGIEATSIIRTRHPQIGIIIISSYYKSSFMGYMMKSGVNAFLPKGITPEKLTEAIISVYSKGYYFMDEQVDVMRQQISSKAPKPILSNAESLTERELEVMKLICQQKTAQKIAEELFISIKTVEGHKSNLFLKTGVKNIAGLVIYAVKNELINLDECEVF